PAPGGFTLLFLGRSPAARLDGLALSWAPDPDHSRILAFDERLHVVRRVSSPRLATPMAVAPLGPGELLVTERTGEGVVLDTAGRPLREWDSPDVASLYAAAGRGRGREGRVVAVRSPYYVPQLASPEPDTAPLIRVLDTLGRPVAGLATIRRPAVPLLSHLVNAGAVVATRHLGAREGAVALDARGGLALLDADSLVGATPPAAGEREPFTPGFALPDLDGDTLTPATFRGKVTLVNFWASWCDPCREEFPHMAALYHEFDRKDFAIAAISDDVDAGKMRAFVPQFRPPFPILVGGGRLKQSYHTRGL